MRFNSVKSMINPGIPGLIIDFTELKRMRDRLLVSHAFHIFDLSILNPGSHHGWRFDPI